MYVVDSLKSKKINNDYINIRDVNILLNNKNEEYFKIAKDAAFFETEEFKKTFNDLKNLDTDYISEMYFRGKSKVGEITKYKFFKIHDSIFAANRKDVICSYFKSLNGDKYIKKTIIYKGFEFGYIKGDLPTTYIRKTKDFNKILLQEKISLF